MAQRQNSENRQDEFQRFVVRSDNSYSFDRSHGVCLRARMKMNGRDQDTDQLERLVLSLVN